MDEKKRQWHSEQVEKFYNNHGFFQKVAETLERVLTVVKSRTDPTALVQVRPKGLASFSEKVIRKIDKHESPVDQLTDLVGGRIVTYTQASADTVCRLIEEEDNKENGGLTIDWDNSGNTADRLKPEEFGYKAMHYIVRLKSPDCFGVPTGTFMENQKMEIQVCTMLEHAWAAIGHDRIYKTKLQISDALRRRLSAISALIETAQAEFENGIIALDRFINLADREISEDQENQVWQSVIDVDKNNAVAIQKLGDHYAALGQWEDAKKHYAKLDKNSPGVLAKLAKSESVLGNTIEAKILFKQAIEKDKRDVFARCEYALLLENENNHDGVLREFTEAFEAAPNSPRVLTEYVARLILHEKHISCISAMRGAFDVIIRECKERAELGVDLANVYLQIGRSYLFQNKLYKSLDAYCKAAVLANSKSNFEYEQQIVFRILEVLESDPSNKPYIETFDCANRLLQLLSVAVNQKSDDSKLSTEELKIRLQDLCSNDCSEKPFDYPVVIVAGGCDSKFNQQIDFYKPTIERAFATFEGTIICGGTTAGISGLVGEISANNRKTTSVGYLPESLPVEDRRDDNYTTIYSVPQIERNSYSPAGPIQTWADLLCSEIDPQEVRLLGINGGKLSGFEFRLAMAMGAKVGLIANSGREASNLLSDLDWQRVGRFASLFDEDATIAPFVTAYCPSLTSVPKRAQSKTLESLARQQHKKYRDDNAAKDGYVHPSMVPWDRDLDTSYKQSNIQQAKYIDQILRTEGFTIVPIADKRKPVNLKQKQYEQQVWRMARLEHGRWNAERLADGWQYGEERSLKNKTNPYLVPWDKLPEPIKQYDCDPFTELPERLKKIQLKVVELKPASKE